MSRSRSPLIPKRSLIQRVFSADVLAPLGVGLTFLLAWDLFVQITGLPPYLLPRPGLVLQTLFENWNELFSALMVTLQITIIAFLAAAVSGLGISVLFTVNKWIERSLFPYAVILQTTPLVAIAPLIVIWLKDNTLGALVLCAWIAAFFPVVANTTLGLNSVDRNLTNLFKLYNTNPWQRLIYLRLPSALPYFLGGLRISGGLSLIGAVVAEFVAGTGGAKSGIAYQILIASYNLQIPKMFAALLLVTGLGILIFVGLSALSDALLKDWHESAVKQES
ncbi:ABC transporter ATP-binding protein [Limnothrix sp. PR1529]|uniref:ABC transporter permease n=1 Tax=Limnothrix sp. PR1529 TaxID=1704291 RepID=UPI00081D8B1F|nr:ABC transporter permease [Limnothrix sp. PR1529]OCQ90262.1 ABC transporter ATP-binding protein [Limnothrix sp. P13C2]PIB14740.1 ABC transporter ATP-binding protein [Limnothrix sp. PR1529]